MRMPSAPLFRLFVCCILFAQLLPACTSLPVYSAPPAGITVEPCGRVAADAPFAPDPTGTRVAMARGGLALFDVATGRVAQLADDTPQALAWASDGHRLAAVFGGTQESRVRIYDAAGTTLGASTIPGTACTLIWHGDDELLIAALELKSYSFGTNFKQLLYRWDGTAPPVMCELYNSTLRAKVNKALGPILPRLFTVALSPYGDAIVYARLQDPPAFSPRLRFILRNLASGGEHEVAVATVDSGGAVFAGSDDTIWYGDGATETVRWDPWQERKLASLPHPGSSLAASPGGGALFVDGRLYRNGQLLLTFPADAAGAFTADGTRLFVRHKDRLWRSDGLITPADFTSATDKEARP
jgi:hypothetical protein